jgi:hypothetical protein
MPVLFDLWGTGLAAATSNVVNGLKHSDGQFYYPNTGCNVFNSWVSQQVTNGQPVNVWPLHCLAGEIHCATAAIRQLSAQPPWWQQVSDWE